MRHWKKKASQYIQQRKLKWTNEYMTEWRSNMIDKKIIPFVNDPICWPDDIRSQINNIRFGDYMYNMFLFLEEKKRNVGLKSLFMAMKPFYFDVSDPTKLQIECGFCSKATCMKNTQLSGVSVSEKDHHK